MRIPPCLALLALTSLLCSCATAPATKMTPSDRTPVPPGINARFLDPLLDPADFVARWEVESREVVKGQEHIVAACGLESGDRIADIGSGTGLYLRPFSEAVGSRGRVRAVEIAPNFVRHLRRRLRNEGFANVEVIHSTERSTELAPSSVDLAFVCDTYHHFEYHEDMLASIRRALAPGGRLVIVDFERIPGQSRPWLLEHVRAGKAVVRREIEEAGFDFEDEVEIPEFRENYLLRFRKPSP
jgi:predicted methyltransferase